MRPLRTPSFFPGYCCLLWGVALAVFVGSPIAAAQEPADPQADSQEAIASGEQPGAPAPEESSPEVPTQAAPAPEELEPEDDEPQISDESMDEIVVRGSQRDELLQDVSVAVTSFGSAAIKSLRIRNIADVADYTPNLEINTAFAASNPTLFIRGIGLKDYNANAASAVAVYQDGININSPAIQLFQFFDVESVEVQRGPQGSLNGRNATAGAIMANSVLPGDEFDVTGSVTYGNYNLIQLEGGTTVPLIDEKLSMRAAFTVNLRDGTTDNQCADWDPPENGFAVQQLVDAGIAPVVTGETTEETYRMLDPLPGIADGSQTGRPIALYRGGSTTPTGPTTDDFVYLNVGFAQDLGKKERFFNGQVYRGAVVNTGTAANQWRLAEDYPVPQGTILHVVSPNGTPAGTPLPTDEILPVGTQVGLQGKRFNLEDTALDGVCIVKNPGSMITYTGEYLDETDKLTQGMFREDKGVQELADFQGLKHRLNNVDDWAARAILRYQPLDGMEWILNGHGGQNRSDSRHLQMLGAQGDHGADPDTGQGVIKFQEALEAGLWSEAGAARLMEGTAGWEGTKNVKGLEPSGNSFPGEGSSDPFKGSYNQDGTEYLDAWGSSLRGDWDLGAFQIRSLSGYEWYDRFVEDEGDASPINSFPADWKDSAWQATQELRVEGETERYIWRTGFFFLYEKLDAFNLFPDTRNLELEQTFDQELLSVAPYAAGRMFLTEELNVDAGLRFNWERKEFTLGTTARSTVTGLEFDEIPDQTVEKTWTGVTGDFTLSYTPQWSWLGAIGNHGLDLYAKYARGMKGGHFNAGLTVRDTFAKPGEGSTPIPRVEPVEPEFIDSIEVGFKSRWFDDRLVLSAAAFRYWYEDLQVFDIVNELGQLPLQQLLNADARVWGAEMEFQIRPLEGLLMQGGVGWLDTEFIDFTVNKATQGGGVGGGSQIVAPFDYSGNPLIAAPEASVSAVVEYQLPLSRWGTLVPQYDFSYRTKVYLDAQAADPISQDAYILHNARLAYRTRWGERGWRRSKAQPPVDSP